MDCGFPALPDSTNISVYKKRYEEYSYVEYGCDSSDKELIGDLTLRCFNGKWIGIVPKCAIKSKFQLKSLSVPNPNNDKLSNNRIIKFFTANLITKECYKPEFSWNLTSHQKFHFDVRCETRVDYFSLILYGNELFKSWQDANLKIIAKIPSPRKQCLIKTFELIDKNLDKIKISFICYAISNSKIGIPETHSSKSNSMKVISFEVQSKYQIFVTFCLLKLYSFSDSCGLPEKPLHSIELQRDKSFTIFSCEHDFYLEPISSQKVICGQSGDWIKQFPQCLSKTNCRLPAMEGTDHYIHVDYKDLNYLNGTPFAETNSVAIYSCRSTNKTNIRLIGDNQRVCIKGFWSGSQPKCIETIDTVKNANKNQTISKYTTTPNPTNIGLNPSHSTNDSNWFKLHLIVISMLVSFLIGVSFIGFILFLVMKYVVRKKKKKRREGNKSKTSTIPSLIVSEPNVYYEQYLYGEHSYESVRMEPNAYDLMELQRINSLYQINNCYQRSS